IVDGADNSATVTFTGDIAHLNAALYGVTYRPDANFQGSDALTITINDGGHSGGAAQAASASIAITVDQTDAPVLDPAATPTFSVFENTLTGSEVSISSFVGL